MPHRFSHRFALLAGAALGLAAAPARAQLTISSAPTRNVTCTAGTCTGTAAAANLNIGKLQAVLAAGDTQLVAGQAQNIVVATALIVPPRRSFTMSAQGMLTVSAPIIVNGASALTLSTHYGPNYAVGRYFGAHGSLQFRDPSASSLTINGNAYKLVASVQELASAVATYPSGYIALASDYDATPDGAYTNSPVPTQFDGVFEGLGNSISHLKLANLSVSGTSPTYAGLFTTLFFDGVISNLRMTGANISSGTSTVGALAGMVEGTLYNDRASGTISGTSGSIGGLAGYLYSNTQPVFLCASAVTLIEPTGGAGGLVGSAQFGNIDQSDATGTVRAAAAGGLIGSMYKASIMDSYATGRVIGTTVKAQAGGLAAGISQAAIITSYAAGPVTANKPEDIGGLIGYFVASPPPYNSTLTNDYWDLTSTMQSAATGTGTPTGITGLTTAQLQSGLPAGFNPGIWGSKPSINGGYPYLLANPPR